MNTNDERPIAVARREKRAYVRLVIDTRYSERNGLRLELELLPDALGLAAARRLWQRFSPAQRGSTGR